MNQVGNISMTQYMGRHWEIDGVHDIRTVYTRLARFWFEFLSDSVFVLDTPGNAGSGLSGKSKKKKAVENLPDLQRKFSTAILTIRQ